MLQKVKSDSNFANQFYEHLYKYYSIKPRTSNALS